jgi:hypothetical protein
LADALTEKYATIASRLVLYNSLSTLGDPARVERYGEVARRVSGRSTAA